MQVVSNGPLVDQRDRGHGQRLLGLGSFGNVAEFLRVLLFTPNRQTQTQSQNAQNTGSGAKAASSSNAIKINKGQEETKVKINSKGNKKQISIKAILDLK